MPSINVEQLPLSLYVHIPWCVKKCPYCDFNSHAVDASVNEMDYVEALLNDFGHELSDVVDRELSSIFIGGGTPSLFSGTAIQALLHGIGERIAFDQSVEITLEANPGTIDSEHFRGYRQAGVNRLSIGAQSFDDQQLQALGRIHRAEAILDGFEKARQAGFDNINLDLMFALPGQTLEQAGNDLAQAIALVPEHISWYQLTIEPNTLFHAKPPSVPDDDSAWDIQEAGQKMLEQAGFQQYEVSAYGKQGRRARHNLNYWQFGDYLAIGAGAHSKTTLADGSVLRRWKKKSPNQYMQEMSVNHSISGTCVLSEDDLIIEFMLNGLRLNEGVATEIFEQRTGVEISRITPILANLRQNGLLAANQQRICPTEKGRRFLNDLLAYFEN